jgi:16S rRNA (uracil1498-N3)-methyltransferase
MKQCLRPYSLHIARPLSLQQLCERVQAADAALVAVAGAPPLPEAVAQLPRPPPGDCLSGALCVGPEGDWTPRELEQLLAAGAQPVGLGPLRLRAETAAVSLLAYVRLHML